MGTELKNVCVAYYPETSKRHPIGTIIFQNGCDELIKSDRVELDVTYRVIYFRTDHEGKGLRFNNSKIQLWSLANIAKIWEGRYPLRYDDVLKCYYISRVDKQPYVKAATGSPRLGVEVNYTPHYGCIGPRTSDTVSTAVSANTSISDTHEAKDKKMEDKKMDNGIQINQPYEKDTWCKSTLAYLNKKVVEYLTSTREKDAKILAEAIQVIQREYRSQS